MSIGESETYRRREICNREEKARIKLDQRYVAVGQVVFKLASPSSSSWSSPPQSSSSSSSSYSSSSSSSYQSSGVGSDSVQIGTARDYLVRRPSSTTNVKTSGSATFYMIWLTRQNAAKSWIIDLTLNNTGGAAANTGHRLVNWSNGRLVANWWCGHHNNGKSWLLGFIILQLGSYQCGLSLEF